MGAGEANNVNDEPHLPPSQPNSAMITESGHALSHDDNELDSDVNSDESGDEDYVLKQNPDRQPRISERKRLDGQIFESYTLQRERESPTQWQADPYKSEKGQSTQTYEGYDGRKRMVSDPRDYQKDLYERAKLKNTIVVLPTVMLIDYIIQQELENRAAGQHHRITFFIVEKVILCQQQYRCLKDNLPFDIGILQGNDNSIVNTKEVWEEKFTKHMAFVTTAQVLLDCLNNGFIKMSRINLMVFDEAHHTKKSHPFAMIIKRHYRRELDPTQRPKIMGLTASPVDAKTNDLKQATADLEDMMDSEIATVSDKVLSQSIGAQDLVESCVRYGQSPPKRDAHTVLWLQLRDLVDAGGNHLFRDNLIEAEDISSTLGAWPADRFWSLLVTEIRVAGVFARTQGEFETASVQVADRATETVYQIQRLVNQYDLGSIERSSSQPHLSPKVESLLATLKHEFCVQGTRRCIVFVQKRSTAVILSDLLEQPGVKILGVRPGFLVGRQRTFFTIANVTEYQQQSVLQAFKDGETNCLFATTVAEEGIDIPVCDLVIRFDMHQSAIQYIQSRGRARQKSSRFIAMVQEDHSSDLHLLRQAAQDARLLQHFCMSLPEDRKVQDMIIDAKTAAEAELAAQKAYEIGDARLSYDNSQEVLARYVACVDPRGTAKPEFNMSVDGQRFCAEVILSDPSPVKFVSGHPQPSKKLARGSAAYEACVLLHGKDHLDANLQPTLARKLPAMRNARLAVSENKKKEYGVRLKPAIWTKVGPIVDLWPATFLLARPEAYSEMATPMIVLSREKLPPMARIPLHFGHGRSSLVNVLPALVPLRLPAEKIDLLYQFTLRLFNDIFSKTYDAGKDEFPFLFAPALQSQESIAADNCCDIDWSAVDKTTSEACLAWENRAPDFFENKFVFDSLTGSRKFIIHGLNNSLHPNSPVPDDAVPYTSTAYKASTPDIQQYSNSFFRKRRQNTAWRQDQPVVNAEVLSMQRNYLDPFASNDAANSKCYLILEPLQVSTLPVGTVRMAALLPAIFHRINSCLIALDGCAMLGLDLPPDLALEAFTKTSDEVEGTLSADGGSNYERLEFLGDTFLKMATTISIFTLLPEGNEFEYHVERMVLIANQNLFNRAVDRGLPEYVRAKGYNRRVWYPDLPLAKGKVLAHESEQRQQLSQKTIADVCEAIIGAAYLAGSRTSMDLAVKAVRKMVKSGKHPMKSFQKYYSHYQTPSWLQNERVTEAQKLAVQTVKSHIGYEFTSPALLQSAFTHTSYTYEKAIPDYQRLEFLGDALLDMVIVDYLYHTFPEADPQWLTEHKGAMVSNQFLSSLCVQLQLHKHLRITNSSLIIQRAEYAASLERARNAAEQEASNGTKLRMDYWRNTLTPNKALADVVEAVVGAMFVDSQYNLNVVRCFFNVHVQPFFEDMSIYDTFASSHPVNLLAKKMQMEFECRDWRLLVKLVPCPLSQGIQAITQDDVLCGLMVHGRVVEDAKAKASKDAKAACAEKAVGTLLTMKLADFREIMGCDCGQDDGGEEHENAHGTAI
ncbi:Dicer-like protein-like protein [Emericellopsis cladophorae]|uniref:Dicer-like protein 1 n=1 Tax=Emericellopsis cladophorae TaxID=2686198 RepID=A0A9P9Y887_9HYPO|nr:Dicer-like protein-like protein [Emericellopsis cladophorae]KAI6784800.1 Dicer-like protein-like protein [Emericellopsis cladophorae]